MPTDRGPRWRRPGSRRGCPRRSRSRRSRPCWRRWSATRSPGATGPCSRCCTAPACVFRARRPAPRRRRPRIGPSAGVREGGQERVVPLGRHAVGALYDWLRPGGRPELEPERWARRGDAEAVFLNRRGGRLSRQGAWRHHPAPGRPPASPAGSRPRCATRAPPTCWTTGPTSAPSRSCSGTPRSAPRRCTPGSRPSGCGRPTGPHPVRSDDATLPRFRTHAGRPTAERGILVWVPSIKCRTKRCSQASAASSRRSGGRLRNQIEAAGGVAYDENFADSGRVAAEARREPVAHGPAHRAAPRGRPRPGQARRRHLRPVRGLRQPDQRGASRPCRPPGSVSSTPDRRQGGLPPTSRRESRSRKVPLLEASRHPGIALRC